MDTFAWRLRRAFTLFGDPHSALRVPLTKFIPRGAAPFLAVPQGRRVLALGPDRTAFVNGDCPYLEGIDGRPISEWLRVAGLDVPRASPQSQREQTVAGLRRLNYMGYIGYTGYMRNQRWQLCIFTLIGTGRCVRLCWAAKAA